MTTRADFTDEEWYRVRAAPWQVAMGVIEVDPHGTFATGRELRAAEAEFARAAVDDSAAELIRLVAQAIVDDVEDTGEAPVVSPDDQGATLPDQVLLAMAALVQVLQAKVTPEEEAAYRHWLLDVATVTARASKEGIAGVAGRKVSGVEQSYLDRLWAELTPTEG